MTDILTRLHDEADLCRNDGANDIAQLLDDAVKEIERMQKIESAAVTLRSRCIVEGVHNPKMKAGYHVEVRTDVEAWKAFWDTLPMGDLAVKEGLVAP